MIVELVLAAATSAIEIRVLKPGEASPPAAIEDVSWLAGRWIGDGLDGCAEEYVARPAGGQMMGMFRQLKSDGSLRFYEFYTINEVNGSLLFRIKHFSPSLVGWEEKDKSTEFRLVAIEGVGVFTAEAVKKRLPVRDGVNMIWRSICPNSSVWTPARAIL